MKKIIILIGLCFSFSVYAQDPSQTANTPKIKLTKNQSSKKPSEQTTTIILAITVPKTKKNEEPVIQNLKLSVNDEPEVTVNYATIMQGKTILYLGTGKGKIPVVMKPAEDFKQTYAQNFIHH